MPGREPDDIACARLIPEKIPGSEKDERQDDCHHNVILPASAGIVPEQKSFDTRQLPAGHMTSILTCGLRINKLQLLHPVGRYVWNAEPCKIGCGCSECGCDICIEQKGGEQSLAALNRRLSPPRPTEVRSLQAKDLRHILH